MKATLSGLQLDVVSTAGRGTCIQLPQYSLAFDMGIAPPGSERCSTVFCTHTHADHIAGM